jgi:hypothetical protein
MQLPRGTFREIRKIVAIESVLKELEGEKFSGIANLSSQSVTGTLVFRAGKCILVKFGNSRGDTAWDELQKAGGEEVDAAISLLGEAQIELALEFNKSCRVARYAKQAQVPGAPKRPAPFASREPPRASQAQKTPAATAVSPLKPPAKHAPTRHQVPVPPAAVPQAPVHAPVPQASLFFKAAAPVSQPQPVPVLPIEETRKDEAAKPPENDDDFDSFESDFDTFESMDFDNVTDKIRSDCKTMIKQLHLDHLMER